MHTLAAELANEQTETHIRRAAGLAFKNALAARVSFTIIQADEQDSVNQSSLSDRWLELPSSATAPLKQSLLSTLGSPQHAVGGVAAQCISAAAAVELPVERWPELIPALLEYVGNQDNVGLRVNTLQAVGYICEVIVSEAYTRSSPAVTRDSRREIQ
jgi:importin subunit beta-1